MRKSNISRKDAKGAKGGDRIKMDSLQEVTEITEMGLSEIALCRKPGRSIVSTRWILPRLARTVRFEARHSRMLLVGIQGTDWTPAGDVRG